MTDRRSTIAVDLGSSACRMCVCGRGTVQVEVDTPPALSRSMTQEGAEVSRNATMVFLKKLVLNNMFCNVENTGFVVCHNTLCRETLREALLHSLTGCVLVNAQACALAACGAVTGVVLDIGYHETRCVPLVEGTILDSHCHFSSSLSSQLVYSRFKRRFEELNPSAECHPVYLERHGTVQCNGGEEVITSITYASGCLQVPASVGYDALFDGSEPSADGCTLQSLLLSTLAASDTVNRRALASTIVLSGAVAATPGFAARFKEHLDHPTLVTLGSTVLSTSFPQKHLNIIGASVMKSVPQLL
eukprot:TRINITY_DN3008_c0_g1_i1.p1 TRINITY_DN3008_c0_g1~~TRINITY_DN3008_c0_g1_i1.p1  ORF type:complete len:303 (+),score=48.86 TRINITY_DN3008_c0_g1_i1:330-1238(+)